MAYYENRSGDGYYGGPSQDYGQRIWHVTKHLSTIPCTFWARGYCREEGSCRYLHDEELNGPWAAELLQWTPCPWWDECRKQDCLLKHPNAVERLLIEAQKIKQQVERAEWQMSMARIAAQQEENRRIKAAEAAAHKAARPARHHAILQDIERVKQSYHFARPHIHLNPIYQQCEHLWNGKGRAGHDDALRLWARLCRESGISWAQLQAKVDRQQESDYESGAEDFDSDGSVCEEEDVSEAEMRVMISLLPGFVAYLQINSDPEDWDDSSWTDFLDGLHINQIQHLGPLLHFGFQLDPSASSRPILGCSAYNDRYWGSTMVDTESAYIVPCLDEEAMIERYREPNLEVDDLIGLTFQHGGQALRIRYLDYPDDDPGFTGEMEHFVEGYQQMASVLDGLGDDRLARGFYHHALDNHSSEVHASALQYHGSDCGISSLNCHDWQWQRRPITREDKVAWAEHIKDPYGGTRPHNSYPLTDSEDEEEDTEEEEGYMPAYGNKRGRAMGNNSGSAKDKKQRLQRPSYHRTRQQPVATLTGSSTNISLQIVSLMTSGALRSLRISEIHVTHYELFIKNPGFTSRLTDFSAGNSDSGAGSNISAQMLCSFVSLLPNILHIDLDSHTSADESVLSAICRSCPQIRYIGISGHDRCHGAIKNASLKPLLANSSWAPQLIELQFIDQGISGESKIAKQLLSARPELAIETGETEGSSMASRMCNMGGIPNMRYCGKKAPGAGFVFF